MAKKNKKDTQITTVADIVQNKDAQSNPEFDSIDKIISGKAKAQDYEIVYEKGVEIAPQSYLSFLSEKIIQTRRMILITLYKWIIPILKVAMKITASETYMVPKIQVAVVVKNGNGSTTMSRIFFSALSEMIGKDTNLMNKISPFFIDKHGGAAGELTPGSGKFPIIVMDGIPSNEVIPQQIRKQFFEYLGTSPVFCFIEDASQLKTLFASEPFIVKVPELTAEEILEIANLNHYIPETTGAMEMAKLQISELISRDISPKLILNILAESGNILLRDPLDDTSNLNVKRVERAFSTIMKNHTDISTFETIPLNMLEDYIEKEIFDQKTAIKTVTDSIAVLQYGLTDPEKPLHSMIFLGPTGVGKTELANSLSRALFGRKDIVRIDMSEYSQPHHVEKLFGSAPGYVGFGQETKLTRELTRRNKGVLLLDEIEKAHPEVHNAILQLLDYGKFTTGTGQVIDASGYIIIMTSNALVKDSGLFQKSIGFEKGAKINIENDQKARKMLVEKANFAPEFVNRIDSVVWFDPISDQTARKIFDKFFNQMKETLSERNIQVEVTERYISNLISKRNPAFGGRDVRRLVAEPKMEIISQLRNDPSRKTIYLDTQENIQSKDTGLKKVLG